MNEQIPELLLPPTATALNAMRLIDLGAVQIALVVDSKGRLLGTVTDGDIRRAILRGKSLETPISECMNKNFKFVRSHEDKQSVLAMMRDQSLLQIPVLDKEGCVKDLLCIRDLFVKPPLDNPVVIMAGGKGKRLRPRLSLLSAKICGDINVKTYKVASLLEILHVATLVHDDVVDESDLRRGWPSVGRIWKNKLSILVGDYLFSKALTNMADIESIESVKILANLASRLSQGEILQIEGR